MKKEQGTAMLMLFPSSGIKISSILDWLMQKKKVILKIAMKIDWQKVNTKSMS